MIEGCGVCRGQGIILKNGGPDAWLCPHLSEMDLKTRNYTKKVVATNYNGVCPPYQDEMSWQQKSFRQRYGGNTGGDNIEGLY